MGFFSDVTAGGVLNTIGQVFGKQNYSVTNPPAYDAEATRTQSYAQKQNSNTLLYIGIGGIGLLMMIFMMK